MEIDMILYKKNSKSGQLRLKTVSRRFSELFWSTSYENITK